MVRTVKDRRGSRGEVGVGVGTHEERAGRGELQNTLLSHKCMCEHTHTHIQAYTLALTDILYVHMKAHKQFKPKVGNFTSKPMLDGFDSYLGYNRRVSSLSTRFPFSITTQVECEKRSSPFFSVQTMVPGKYSSCCYQSSPLSSGHEHTEVHRHAHARTYNNTHDRMVGSRHTQARCGERSKSKSLYLIAQQSGVECSAYFEHVQIRCFFFFFFLVLSFYFQALLTSLLPFFLSTVGGTVPGTGKKKRKEEKK